MKIIYVFPRVVDDVLQNTTENEIARALKRRGCIVDTVQAYRRNQLNLNGFSKVDYIKIAHYGLLAKIRLHSKSLLAALACDYDVAIFGYSSAHLIPLVALTRLWRTGPKLVLDIRSVPVDVDKSLRGRLLEVRYRVALRVANRWCDGVTTITPMLRDTIKPFLSRHRDHIVIWSSGVDLDHFCRRVRSKKKTLGLIDTRVILYHGELSSNRGIQNIIKAVALLSDEMKDLRFLVVGDGSGRSKLEELAEELDMADRVIFVGRKPYEEIPNYIASADIGVLPFPNIEWWAVSSPIKLMEYLAMGVPIVATDIPAVRMVVEQTGGAILVPSDHPEALAKGVRELFVHGCEPAKRGKLENTISWYAQGQQLLSYLYTL